MNGKLELAQDRLIERIGKICDDFGLNKFVAQLYTVLYLSGKPLSLDDLVERLKVSKGNISLNIRELEKWGAVRSVWVKGSRKDYYEAEPDIKKVITNKVRSSAQRRISEVSDMISDFNSIVQSANGELSEDDKAIIKVCEDRLKKVEDLNKLAKSAMVVFEKFLG